MTADLFYLGLTQRNAPLAVRELISPSVAKQRAMLDRLGSMAPGRMVVSTCERFELYVHAEVRDARTWRGRVAGWFHLPNELVERHARSLEGAAVARHLLSVSAGLDSRVLGEPQILGQVRDAYLLATESAALDPVLSALGRAAIRTGKRVRSETPINRGSRSIPTLAVDRVVSSRPESPRNRPEPTLAHGGDGGPLDSHLVVLGSGRLAQDVSAEWVRRRGGSLTVIAREPARARGVAEPFRGSWGGMNCLAEAIARADAVVACTAAPSFLIDAEAIGNGRERDLSVVDLCVPRNVDPGVSRLPRTTLIHLDELLAGNAEPARIEADAVRIVETEWARFERWRRERAVSGAVARMIRESDSGSHARSAETRQALHRRIVQLKSHGLAAAAG